MTARKAVAPNVLVKTEARDWNPTKLLKLPSGKVAVVAELDLSILIKLGKFPDFLTPHIEKVFTGDITTIVNVMKEKGLLEVLRGERAMLEAFAEARFVSPRIVANPDVDNDEIDVNWLSLEDLQFVMSDLISPSNALLPFLDGQTPSVEPVGNVEPASGTSE